MDQNVPLRRLSEVYRELEAATDVASSFQMSSRDAIHRLALIESAIQTLRPVCVIPAQVKRPGEPFPKYDDVLREAVRAFEAPEGFFEGIDQTLAQSEFSPLNPITQLILLEIQRQGATSEQVDQVGNAFRKFDSIQPLLASLSNRWR